MEYLNIMEAARRCQISDKTIRRAIHAGELRATFPKKNRCQILLRDLEAWRQLKADATDQRLAALETRIAELESQVHRLTEQLTALEVRPQALSQQSVVKV